jgi:hypothetical protein
METKGFIAFRGPATRRPASRQRAGLRLVFSSVWGGRRHPGFARGWPATEATRSATPGMRCRRVPAVARAGGQAHGRSGRLRAGLSARSGEVSWREGRRRLSWWTAASSRENRMPDGISQRTPEAIAAETDAHIRCLVVRKTPGVRAVRGRYSRMLAEAAPAFVLAVSKPLLERCGLRSIAYDRRRPLCPMGALSRPVVAKGRTRQHRRSECQV